MTINKTPKKKQLTASEMGKLGGNAIAKKGSKHMSDLGKRGAAVRWSKSGKLSSK